MKQLDSISSQIIDILLTECRKSNCCRHKHAAGLFHNRMLICASHNNENGHAEINCIKQIPKKIKFQNPLVLYVIRSNNNINILHSKPCAHCTHYIQNSNIGQIIYSTNDFFIKESTASLFTTHISYGHKNKSNKKYISFPE